MKNLILIEIASFLRLFATYHLLNGKKSQFFWKSLSILNENEYENFVENTLKFSKNFAIHIFDRLLAEQQPQRSKKNPRTLFSSQNQ